VRVAKCRRQNSELVGTNKNLLDHAATPCLESMSQACLGKRRHKEELSGSANGHVSLVGSGNIFTAISKFRSSPAPRNWRKHMRERTDWPSARRDPSYACESRPPWWRPHRSPERRQRNNKIEVNRRTVSPTAAQVVCLCRWPRSVRLQQQIDGRRGPKHFHANEPTCRPTCKPIAWGRPLAGRRHRR
jgi:hypothetical protein